MNKLIVILFVILAMTSCSEHIAITPKNETVTTEYDFQNITDLDISGDFDVQISISNSNTGVITEFDRSMESLIEVENLGGTLKVSYNKAVQVNGNIKNTIYLTSEMIHSIQATEEVRILSDLLTSDQLKISMTADCEFAAPIEVKELTMDLTADSKVGLRGFANEATINLTAESILRGFELRVDNLDINLTAQADAELTVNESLNVIANSESIPEIQRRSQDNRAKYQWVISGNQCRIVRGDHIFRVFMELRSL